MSKPVVFISHIHEDENCANAFEQVLRKALLGAFDVFNSSNRRSIAIGDPFRDRIVEYLKRSATALVLASPDSVSSPWVNFETGGAWVAGTRVIPACIRGMKPESLPAPLSYLHAVSLDSPKDLQSLIKHLAETAGLEEPFHFDFDQAARAIAASWMLETAEVDNSAFVAWYLKVCRRPEKYKGDTASGFLRVKTLIATDQEETGQFPIEGMKPGDAIRVWFELDAPNTYCTSYCFAVGPVADFLEQIDETILLRGTLKGLGLMTVFTTQMSFGYEKRVPSSSEAAWLITDVAKA